MVQTTQIKKSTKVVNLVIKIIGLMFAIYFFGNATGKAFYYYTH